MIVADDAQNRTADNKHTKLNGGIDGDDFDFDSGFDLLGKLKGNFLVSGIGGLLL